MKVAGILYLLRRYRNNKSITIEQKAGIANGKNPKLTIEGADEYFKLVNLNK